MYGDVDRHGHGTWPFQVPGGYLFTMPPAGQPRAGQLVTGSPSLASGQYSAAADVGGNANVSVGVLVAVALAVLLGFHLLGFRFGFDVSVGRS